MSGSSSSDPAAPEAVSLTVHSMPAPDLRRRRVVGGRLRLLLVLAACAAPVIASYFTYYVLRPGARANYATLIEPTRAMPADLALRTLDGTAVAAGALRGQWLLVTVSDAACDAACERRLYLQRQLREMLGRERERVDRVWLVTGDAALRPELVQAATAAPGLSVWRVGRADLARWLAPAPGQTLEDHFYIVDPFGAWMMRAPGDADPGRLKRDLARLLRASSSWDRPGR